MIHRALTVVGWMLFLAGLGLPIVWTMFPNLSPVPLIVDVPLLWGLAFLAARFSKEKIG